MNVRGFSLKLKSKQNKDRVEVYDFETLDL